MNISEFKIESLNEEITCWLASPDPSKIHKKSGLLLNISATRQYALLDSTQNHPTEPFLDAGHHVLSFDLPHHGERVKQVYSDAVKESANGYLEAMGRALAAGDDPFKQFVEDGKTSLNVCIEKGIAPNGKIVAYGVSRGAYCLLRLAAEDKRVHAVAGPSPVTDWSVVTEFANQVDPSITKQIHIENWIDHLGEKAVYLSVGSQDTIIDTDSCVQFSMELFDKQKQILPEGVLYNQLHVVNSPSHSPSKYSRLDATQFLLKCCE